MATTQTRKRKSLIHGRQMCCPRCKRDQDILAFKPLGQIDEYVHATNPIYACPLCNWKFSPAAEALVVIVRTQEEAEAASLAHSQMNVVTPEGFGAGGL